MECCAARMLRRARRGAPRRRPRVRQPEADGTEVEEEVEVRSAEYPTDGGWEIPQGFPSDVGWVPPRQAPGSTNMYITGKNSHGFPRRGWKWFD